MDIIQKKLEEEAFLEKKGLYGKLSILSVLSQHIAIGSILPLAQTSMYFISYLSYNNKKITPSDIYFFLPILTLGGAIFGFIGGILNNKYGPKLTILFGNTIFMINGIILYSIERLFWCYIIFFIYGAVMGISVKIANVNMVKYYFDKKGLVMGLTSSINSLLSSGIITFAEKIVINPNSYTLHGEKFYPKEIGVNYKKFALWSVVICGISTVITLLLLQPFPKFLDKQHHKQKNEEEEVENLLSINDSEKIIEELSNSYVDEYTQPKLIFEIDENNLDKDIENNNEENNKNINNKNENNKIENNKNINNKDVNNKDVNNKDVNNKDVNNKNENDEKINEEDEEDKKSVMTYSQIKKAVTSFRFWRLFIITITRGPISLLLHSTLRNIATVEVYQESVTTTLIQNIATIRPIINAFLNPLLGLLSDRFKYKYFLIFIHLSYIIFGISYPFILKNNILVYIWILYFTIPHAMILIATPPHFMKIFGMKHYIEVSGIYSFSTIINSTISSVFAFTIENIFKNDMEKGYKLMFISSGLLCIVSFFLGLSEEETPFDYSD